MLDVHVLLGGVTGGALEAYIPGINTGILHLADDISALGNARVRIWPWGDWRKCAETLVAGARHVLIGYSGGGTRAIYVARTEFSIPIDLMVLYDPSPDWQIVPVPGNVKHCICYWNKSPLMFGLGGGKPSALSTKTHLEIVPVSMQHLAVQYSQVLHTKTLGAIKELLK